MMLDQFAKYIMRGRRQAIIVALLFTVVPFFSWVSIVITGLVTLCKGPYEGFLVLMWTALPFVVYAAKGMWLPLVINVAFGSCLVWLLAMILRRFASWSLILELLSLLAIVVILVAHYFMPHLQAFWSAKLMHMMSLMESHLGKFALPSKQLKPLVNTVAYYATGAQACYIIFTVLVELAFARMLQAKLFFPGRLKQEWMQLRLNYIAIIVLVVVGALAFFGSSLFKDTLPVVLLPFLIVGISVGHGYFSYIKPSLVWLFYIMVIVLAMVLPLVVGSLLVLLAMIDTVFPIRKHWAVQN